MDPLRVQSLTNQPGRGELAASPPQSPAGLERVFMSDLLGFLRGIPNTNRVISNVEQCQLKIQ